MLILGISGSPRPEKVSGTYRLVRRVLEATGLNYELVSLRKKHIGGCIACLGCAKDNVCKVEDDLAALREKIVTADAYVIGAPNYYSGLNALTHAFLERWFQFRHQEGNLLWGKLAVAVGVGGTQGHFPADDLERFLAYNFIETVAKVSAQGAASCYTCGYGDTCKVGIPYLLGGQEGQKFTEETIPDVEKDPACLQAAEEAGRLLAKRLTQGHDRNAVTARMQQAMMAKFSESA
ncbi:Multimeric flavodoxin WrbA [Desulfacinum hydrothermale DSM 13146]|uniref:Multimeric flavodoxin WrbA n=1 Tax=Desulfacinum hydrothermale DSM 13146 TaxID=1121390 RepID=A0A1W1WWZ6_9BACT|nr:flavodoxin family protein [Desulfacinum hydrothermale]SMC16266.1 Multimeric flavodoxin WrbA [Desulfacinum hydrothermale DSM 13146]